MTTAIDLARVEAEIETLVAALADALLARGWRLATAESCTGGLIAGACTERAGSSDWFERGVVSYSNAAKTELLDVPAALIVRDGAVSESVAAAMADGARRRSGTPPSAAVALSVTGIAGPSGGSAAKPVGTVCFGWALPDRAWTQTCRFDGDRRAVRRQSVRHALQALLAALPAA